jgi:hypothetical protein
MQYGDGHYVPGSRTPPTNTTPRHIARALSRIYRFTGHSQYQISVARHSTFVATILDDLGYSPQVQLYGLVHDIHETVVNDLNWAVKNLLSPVARQSYDGLADAADEALYAVLGVSWPMPPGIQAAVKVADWMAVASEKRDLMPKGDRPWPMLIHKPSVRQALATWDPDEDMIDWLGAFSMIKTAIALEGPKVSQEIYAV